jgi:hypothetical protein
LSKTLAQDEPERCKEFTKYTCRTGILYGSDSDFLTKIPRRALQQFQSENNIEPTGRIKRNNTVFINNLLQSETPQQTAPVKDTSVDATKTKVLLTQSVKHNLLLRILFRKML